MSNISCPPGHPNVSKSIYDRELDTILFKRLHGTNYTLAPKRSMKILGPGSYNPRTIEEIYRNKSCSKYGQFYQQSKRFPTKSRQSKHLCRTQQGINGLYNIPDELLRKKEFERRYNSIRLDRQSSNDRCRKQKNNNPPVTLYEKRSIYGPYTKFAKERTYPFPDWYKGPACPQGLSPPSILLTLFSRSNRYKGKFLPLPSNLNSTSQRSESPGPTTYFSNNLISSSKIPSPGFLSSTERFPQSKLSLSSLGPASYNPHTCRPLCSKTKQKKF